MSGELKLTVEMIPATSWYCNMRQVLSTSDWDRIRKTVYADYGYRCGICGAQGRLNCHERWEFDDPANVQTLVGFIALCDMCHHVKHIGLADVFADEGKLDYEAVVAHFMRVNGCDHETFHAHRDKAVFGGIKRPHLDK